MCHAKAGNGPILLNKSQTTGWFDAVIFKYMGILV